VVVSGREGESWPMLGAGSASGISSRVDAACTKPGGSAEGAVGDRVDVLFDAFKVNGLSAAGQSNPVIGRGVVGADGARKVGRSTARSDMSLPTTVR